MTIIYDLKIAKDILYQGDVLAIPTETVYGLAASIKNENALKKVFAIKERPFFDPLIVHIASLNHAKEIALDWTEIHQVLAQNCWPGPLTLLVNPKPNKINPIITSGLTQVGLRCPNHPLTLSLLQEFPEGLAAPSANKFGKTSPTTSKHVEEEFNSEIKILEGGTCEVGIESSVIGIEGKQIKIFRAGFYNKHNLSEILKKNGIDQFTIEYAQSPVAPGHLEHHYMPKIPLYFEIPLNKLNFPRLISWTLPSDPIMVARILYQKFRDFSALPFDAVCISLPNNVNEKSEEWQGVLNRLRKASTKHSF